MKYKEARYCLALCALCDGAACSRGGPWLGEGVPGAEEGLIKDVLEALLGECGALEERIGADGAGDLVALGGGHGLLAALGEALQLDGVLAEVHLAAAEDHVAAGGDALDLRGPAPLDVLQRGVVHDGVAQNEDVGLVVAQGAQALVVLLAGRVEELQRARAAVDMHGGREGVEDGGDVVRGELVFGVAVHHARLADRAVADEDGFHSDEVIFVLHWTGSVAAAGHEKWVRDGEGGGRGTQGWEAEKKVMWGKEREVGEAVVGGWC